jgi:hypothetical protein
MKIRNWRKAIWNVLAAGGLFLPCTAYAADLNTNLVVNGNFENVDLAVIGNYDGPRILNWTGPNLFAYSHDGSSSSGGVVPDYADGADPPNAGHWYFTSNNTGVADPTDLRGSNAYFQDVDLSTGATATAIAAGTATYSLQGFFSSYLNDGDYGNVDVDFWDATGFPVGAAHIDDSADAGPNNVWSLISTSGNVPASTASVRISLFGTPVNFGADGYIDNVDFRIIAEPSTIVWDNSTGNAMWSDALNWAGDSEPTSQVVATLPAGFPNGDNTITLANEAANSLAFNDSYILSGGSITLPDNAVISVDTGKSATITSALTLNGALVKAGSGSLTVNHVRATGLAVNAGTVAIAPNGTNAGTSNLGALTIAGATDAWTAKFDLNNNDAVVRSTAATKAADLARLTNQLKQGYASSAWNGNGITSSTAAANANLDTGLALVDNAVFGFTDFSGQTVNNDSILLKYTYYGDIDVNGQVDADDLTIFANNFGRTTGAGQVDGDIDFDNDVDADDLTVFANNFGKGIGSPLAAGSVQAVPEPASLVLAGLAAIVALAKVYVQRRRL